MLGTFTAELQNTFAGPFAAGEFRMVQRQRGVFARPSATMGAYKSQVWCKQQGSLWRWTSFQAWRYGVGAVPKSCCGKPRVNSFKLFLSAARQAVISSTESNPGAG